MNHFPGTWELGRKDHLYKHLAAARRRHPLHYDFLPGVFLLPEDHGEAPPHPPPSPVGPTQDCSALSWSSKRSIGRLWGKPF